MVGFGIAAIAEVFSGSGDTPCLSMTCPKNVSLSLLNSYLSLFKIIPISEGLCPVDYCAPVVFFQMSVHRPWYIKHCCSRSVRIISKCSGTLEMLSGILLKQYLLNGVMKFVICYELSSSGICQNSLFASILLRTVAPASCARVLLTFGRGSVSVTLG